MLSFKDSVVLVVGGAGFVGSNLINEILLENPKKIIVVDNLLSSNITNVSLDQRVEFVFGSITEDKLLTGLSDQIEFVFHLACYHGNQSSIADPIADHANNTLHNIEVFERLKDMHSVKKVVYAATRVCRSRKDI